MASNNVLVTGGAGYIGSHTVLALRAAGWSVVVIDNLSTGSRKLVPDDVILIEGDVADKPLVQKALRKHSCRAVLHFAGSIVVPESVVDPLKYYRNNTLTSHHLIEACVDENVNNLIFSSTAAVYGNPPIVPVKEETAVAPINPYGTSKLMTEWVLRDTAAATDLRYAALRYFNVAGADPDGRSGQTGPQSSHLIRVACEAATGKRKGVEILGSDYNTRDGTCIRDYIHVTDLAEAHVLTLEHLLENRKNLTMNCGYGRGYSVKEVLDTVNNITDGGLNITMGMRREGDPAELLSDPSLLRATVGWKPRLNDLTTIIQTALKWERESAGG